jgi:heptosyltransferase-2
MDSYKRILLLHTAFLGDIVLVTALIRETRKLFPEAVINFVTSPRTYELLKNNPNLDEVIIFDKHNHKLKNFFALLPKLRKKKYDLAITPHSHLTTNFMMLFAGIPTRIGFDRYRSRKLLTIRIPYRKEGHVSERFLQLLKPFSSDKLDHRTELFIQSEEEDAARKWLSPGKHPVLIAPGSVWATKRLPTEHYSKITRNLSKAGFDLLFIGSKTERELADWIIKDSDSRARNSCGKLSIMESTALISHSQLLITNDSGPLHLANAVDTPVYAFFGPTVKEFGYYPYRSQDKVFELDLECRPCGMHGSRQCPLKHHNCLQKIDIELVVNSILENFQP